MTSGEVRIVVNGDALTWSGGSVLDLLREREVDTTRKGFAVALNGDVLPRCDWEARHLREGDHLEIVGMYKGG